MEAMDQMIDQLSVLYDPEEYTMADSTEIPSCYRCVAIIGAVDSFPQTHLDQLDRYLNSCGDIYVACSNLQNDLNQGFLLSGLYSLVRCIGEYGLDYVTV